MVHQPVSRGLAVFADAWLSDWLAEISADLRENGSALEVVFHDDALYKSTTFIEYFAKSLEVISYESFGTVSYSHSIATMAVSTQYTNVTDTDYRDTQPYTARRHRPRLYIRHSGL